jgi:hypothetical protein
VSVVVAGRPDLAQSSLDGSGRWWRAQIRELEKLGRSPGRWVIADGFIPFPMTGVYFDSFQSQRAMRLFQLMVVFGFFFDGGRPRGGRSRMVRKGSRGIEVIFSCLGFFVKIGWDSCLYILYVHVCIYMHPCMFSLIRNIDTYY